MKTIDPANDKEDNTGVASRTTAESAVAKLAAREQRLQDEIKRAQKELAELTEAEEKLKKDAQEKPVAPTETATNSKIHHGTLPLDKDASAPVYAAQSNRDRKITIQLSDFGIPSIAYDLNKPYIRIPYSDSACLKLLNHVTDGRISERLTETDTDTANKIIAQLEEERAHLRVKFAEYVEFPTHDIVGLPTDDLERKLYARHFRNKEAQHRVFMIGFSVALFCVIGAVLSDALSEGNVKLVTIASTIGAATTALGLAGHFTMRIGDARNEKTAARTIQELALIGLVIEKIRTALR